ncbi:MAG: hypothetical protein ACI9RY_001492, partial [Reinekea sp.]
MEAWVSCGYNGSHFTDLMRYSMFTVAQTVKKVSQ